MLKNIFFCKKTSAHNTITTYELSADGVLGERRSVSHFIANAPHFVIKSTQDFLRSFHGDIKATSQGQPFQYCLMWGSEAYNNRDRGRCWHSGGLIR
jgi:hypothetical protein